MCFHQLEPSHLCQNHEEGHGEPKLFLGKEPKPDKHPLDFQPDPQLFASYFNTTKNLKFGGHEIKSYD